MNQLFATDAEKRLIPSSGMRGPVPLLIAIMTFVIVKIVRARKASREIEKALKAQAEKQANAARPDLEADIRALQGEFNRAITALKSSRLGARGAANKRISS